MKLTARSEYALLAMIHMARNYSEAYLPTERIARAENIPLRFLEQILLLLKRSRYVQSARGQKGGVRLARDPSQITLAEIVRLLDGALAPTVSVSEYFYGATPIEQEEKLRVLFRDIRDYIAGKLEHTTLADLV